VPHCNDYLCFYSTRPDTSLHCEITDGSALHGVLDNSQILLVLTALTRGEMTRLTLTVSTLVAHQDGLPTQMVTYLSINLSQSRATMSIDPIMLLLSQTAITASTYNNK